MSVTGISNHTAAFLGVDLDMANLLHVCNDANLAHPY